MYERDGIGCVNDCKGGARGLCLTHYVGYRYHVKRGNTTWEKLEKGKKIARRLTQAEKNKIQSHPHRKYQVIEKKPKYDF